MTKEATKENKLLKSLQRMEQIWEIQLHTEYDESQAARYVKLSEDLDMDFKTVLAGLRDGNLQ